MEQPISLRRADDHEPPVVAADGRHDVGWGQRLSVGIVAAAAGLMAIGVVMTFSAAVPLSWPTQNEPFWQTSMARQIAFSICGLVAMLIMRKIPYRIWSAAQGLPGLALLLLAVGASLLVFVSGVGVEVNEARRWIRIGPDSLGLRAQPSELVKLAVPIFMAAWLTRGFRWPAKPGPGMNGEPAPPSPWMDIRHFWFGLLPVVALIGVAVMVVGIEDFGTAALLTAVCGAMLLVGGARIWHLLLLVLPTVPVFGYLLLSRSHRMERILTFMDIWKDPEGSGYQAIQSLCTIASGGWTGRGLGQGFIKTYLPEARTDFIFAVICEELGVVGAIAVIGLLLVFLYQAMMVVARCPDPMGRLLAFGIAMTFGIQGAMNIAVVTVSVPTKGIALPLVSAGGSGVILLGVMVGILSAIAAQSDRHAAGSQSVAEVSSPSDPA